LKFMTNFLRNEMKNFKKIYTLRKLEEINECSLLVNAMHIDVETINTKLQNVIKYD